MENLLPAKTSSGNSLAISDAGIAKALRYLGSDQRPTSHTPLLPPHVCDAVIERYSMVGSPVSEAEAKRAVVTLLAGYPSAFTEDSAERLAYMRRVAATFQLYPAWAVAKAISPGFRFPGNASFRPTDKEIASALDDLVREHRAIAVRAQWHKDEGKRRAEEDRIAAMTTIAPDRRAEIVRQALRR